MLLKNESGAFLNTEKVYLYEINEPLNAIIANTAYDEIQVYTSPDHALLEQILQALMVRITKGFILLDVKTIVTEVTPKPDNV